MSLNERIDQAISDQSAENKDVIEIILHEDLLDELISEVSEVERVLIENKPLQYKGIYLTPAQMDKEFVLKTKDVKSSDVFRNVILPISVPWDYYCKRRNVVCNFLVEADDSFSCLLGLGDLACTYGEVPKPERCRDLVPYKLCPHCDLPMKYSPPSYWFKRGTWECKACDLSILEQIPGFEGE